MIFAPVCAACQPRSRLSRAWSMTSRSDRLSFSTFVCNTALRNRYGTAALPPRSMKRHS
jgi:hypothetical protein